VFGISASSRADLLAQIDELGTDLLVVQAGNDLFGTEAQLPVDAPDMVRRIAPVDGASSMSRLETEVQRNRYADDRNGLDVFAAESGVLATLEGSLRAGRFVDGGIGELPAVVLGAVAAERLGIADISAGPTVWIAGRELTVIGILDPLPLHPDLDRSVMIGNAAAGAYLGAEVIPTRIYVRTDPRHVEDVRQVLGRTVSPGAPDEVDVSRPSDALEARARIDAGLQRLLIGLGTVALVVGGVGVANVMVVSVLERRVEIGLRRSLGATRRHIGLQFLVESVSLTTLGGVAGAGVGAAITYLYALRQGWTVDVPVAILAGAVVTALALGAVAGLYPAARAASLPPAEAVRPTG
jgi:putative ABC transport system permease protein